MGLHAKTFRFSLPPVTVDEFFGDNLVTNLATFLGIPSNRIKVSTVHTQYKLKLIISALLNSPFLS